MASPLAALFPGRSGKGCTGWTLGCSATPHPPQGISASIQAFGIWGIFVPLCQPLTDFWGVGVSSCSPFSPSLFFPLTFLLLFPFFSHFLGVGGFFGSFPRGTNTPKMHPSASRSPWIQPKSPCTTITPKPSRTTRLLPFHSKNSQWSLATIPAPRALSIYYIYKNKYINIKEGGFSLKTQCTGLEKSLEKPNGSR